MPYSKIIFDLDGTLVDSRQGIIMALQDACHSVDGKARSFDTSLIGPPVRDMLKQAVPSFSDKELDVATTKFRSIYDDHGWAGYRLYLNVIETIDQIASSGIQIHIATFKPKLPTLKICHDAGLDIYTSSIRSFDENVHSSKVDMIHDFKDQNVLFVGDTNSDYETACAYNFDYVHCCYGFGDVTKPTYSINHFPQLQEILND